MPDPAGKQKQHETSFTLRLHGLVTVTPEWGGRITGSRYLRLFPTDRPSHRAGEPPAPDRLTIGAPDQLAGGVDILPAANVGVPGHEAGNHEERPLAGGREAGDLPEAGGEQGDAVHLPGLRAGGGHAGHLPRRGDIHEDGSVHVDNVQRVGG